MDRRNVALWYLGAGLLAAALHLLLPPDGEASVFAFLAIAVSGPTVMAVGLRPRRHRSAWLLLFAGAALMTGGDALWTWYELRGLDPFPSLADALYLPGYPLIALGLLRMLRDPNDGRDSLLDAAIIATGIGVVSWVFLIAPVVDDPDLTIAERAISTAYPLMGVLLVAVVARLAFARRHARVNHLLLGAGLGSLLIADTYLAVIELTGGYEWNAVAEFLWLAMYVLFGAAALLPAQRMPVTPAPADLVTGSRRAHSLRFPTLMVASLMAPLALAWQAAANRDVELGVVAVGSALLAMLVLVRMLGLLRRSEAQAAEIERLAAADPLTGLPNRRSWKQQFRAILARAERSGESLCVAMIDMDHFKRYNDTHGHWAGDGLLRECGRLWSRELRAGDLLARLGGEEFALALPDCSRERAERVLERLMAVTPAGETFSAGLARWDRDESGQQLLERADRALYEAKAAGRARIVNADTRQAVSAG